ncbi:MAG: adenylate/guanylate cyclase domain-containing protein [Alphaproteobacteria bacterium]|nr:adenylate/guanylate cyclase domain-containing protein [Alphaproteobacteria bacterium]
MTGTPFAEPRRRRSWLPRIPILAVLLVGIGGLVLAAVLTVLLIGLGSSRRNTYDLLSDKADLVMSAIEQQVRLHLEPARHQAEFLARQVAARELDIANRTQVSDTLNAAQAATPEVSSLVVIDTALQATLVSRQGIVLVNDWSDDAATRERLDEASHTKQSFWGEVLWTRQLGAFINLRTPLWRDGAFVGALAAVVQVGNLSRTLLAIPGEIVGRAFILRGRDEVLAHPNLAARRSVATDERQPLPLLGQVDDPVLARIWDPKRIPLETLRARTTEGHLVDIDGRTFVFLVRELGGYGPTPWIIGTYFDQQDVERELLRLVRASLAGGAVLVVALIAAIGFARLLGRPIIALARSAEAVRSLDLAAARPLKRSVVRELDDAGRAFNQMLTGLRWFETYVPRRLVSHLIGRRTTTVASAERRVTVMFTDIRSFTSLSERLSAAEVAALLNEHFALIDRIVEGEEGIVDKYIGDSVMAFWGAPAIEPDHAARALRATRSIATEIASDNRRRIADGLPAIHVAIGLHTGPAIVGNVGPAGRVNYTIVGDTVNSATRILGEAKLLDDPDDVIALASGETVRAAGQEARLCRSVGTRQLRGRMEATELFRIV